MPRKVVRLSDGERHLLSKHYGFYRALATGDRPPTTEAQRHFVAVCRRETVPITEHEYAWMNFRRIMANTNIRERRVVEGGFRLEIVTQNPKVKSNPSVSEMRVRSTSEVGGQLSDSQKKLVLKHYGYWRELDLGERTPANPTEERFVSVSRGALKPITEHEVTYAVFKTYLAARGTAIDDVPKAGFEPIPEVLREPGNIGSSTKDHACPCSGEQITSGWQTRAIESFEQDGKETSEAPGFIYRDDRHGNRRWG